METTTEPTNATSASRIDPREVRIFSGRSHEELAKAVADYLGVPLEETTFKRFSNDNLYIQLGASVRGRSVFIVQSLIEPVSEHLMELFIMLDIARSAGAREVHAIIPYFSYARSDKKNYPRISITARLVADLLETAGATHVMTMTLHSPQVHGFFSVPTDPLTARKLFADYLLEANKKKGEKFERGDTIVVAPDYGRAGSATRLAYRLGLQTIAAEKNRLSDTQVHISKLITRQLEGFRRALIYDDEIVTGGSVLELTRLLVESDIEEIIIMCTHGVFIRNALERLLAIPQVNEVITTDTVPCPPEKRLPGLTILPIAPVIGEAIYRNHTRQSIGNLFAYAQDDE